MRKAFGYVRVSGKSQLDGDGFPRQKAAIKGYAEAHEIRIVKWFEEKAVCGEKDEDERPAFQEMIIAALGNGCHTIIVESMDRFARAYRAQESLITYIACKELTLISANTGEDITAAMMGDPMKRALVQIQGVLSELEKNMIVAKLRKARERMRLKEGRCEGRKPYGDRDGEAGVIDKMRKLADAGRNYTEIADALNQDEVPTRANGSWFPATVSRILARAITGGAR